MDSVQEAVEKLITVNGKPDEGFENFLKTCQDFTPLMTPTKCPNLCKGFKTPSGLILHQVGQQPYYTSRTMQARTKDVLVCSYPKTGTTWTQEICYLILHNADTEKANSIELEDRIPFLDSPTIGSKGIEALADPRLLKTHYPYHDLPESFINNKTKIVYIARNPRDTVVSFYHFMKMVGYIAYDGNIESFLDLFIEGKVVYASFADHCLGFWNKRHDGTILFLTYEELQKDLKAAVRKISIFLEKSLTDDQVERIAEHCSFSNMSKNPMTNYSKGVSTVSGPQSETTFMRKGKVGDWKNHFSEDMIDKLDKYIEKKFKGSGLQFEYTI